MYPRGDSCTESDDCTSTVLPDHVTNIEQDAERVEIGKFDGEPLAFYSYFNIVTYQYFMYRIGWFYRGGFCCESGYPLPGKCT